MYELNEFIGKLIEEKGTNLYQVSKKTGLDRTTLQRLLKGERLPSYEYIKKLCDHLSVSPVQRQEVKKLYEIKKIGIGTYENRIFIKDMIENIAIPYTDNKNLFKSIRDISINELLENESIVIEQNYNIQNTIRNIIEEEIENTKSPNIKITIPFDYHALFDIIMSLCNEIDKKITIDHTIKLSKNPKTLIDKNYNLKVLSKVIPLSFHSANMYIPYYYYGNVELSMNEEVPMPYYIITSKFVILVPASFDKILIHSNPVVVNLYKQSFLAQKNNCKKMIGSASNAQELLRIYSSRFFESNRSATLEALPCFGVYFTDQIIEKKVIKEFPNRPAFIQETKHFYNGVRSNKNNMINYFTREGLISFIKTGDIVDIPDNCIYDFTNDEKKMFLQSLFDDIQNGSFYSRCVNDSRFTLSQHSTIIVNLKNSFMVVNRDKSKNIGICLISESTTTEAFYDFINHLGDSEFICSKEDTLTIIQEVIENYL